MVKPRYRLARAGALALLVAAAVAREPAPARAQPGDEAAAEALFREARALMKRGDYRAACPKLEESQRLDPGVGTLLNLALCYEKTERLASAWAKYSEASEAAAKLDDGRRQRAAAEKAEALEPRLYRLVILVPRRSRIEGLTVRRNGTAVGRGAWGAKVPVDRGKMVIEASADGRRPWRKTVTVGGSRRLRAVEIPVLPPLPREARPEQTLGPNTIETELVPGEPWYRDALGWGLTGAGAAAVGGGLFALIRASSLEGDADDEDDLQERDRLLDSADTSRFIGIGLVAAGAGLAVAGLIKLAVSPGATERPVEPGAALSIRPTTLSLQVRF